MTHSRRISKVFVLSFLVQFMHSTNSFMYKYLEKWGFIISIHILVFSLIPAMTLSCFILDPCNTICSVIRTSVCVSYLGYILRELINYICSSWEPRIWNPLNSLHASPTSFKKNCILCCESFYMNSSKNVRIPQKLVNFLLKFSTLVANMKLQDKYWRVSKNLKQ